MDLIGYIVNNGSASITSRSRYLLMYVYLPSSVLFVRLCCKIEDETAFRSRKMSQHLFILKYFLILDRSTDTKQVKPVSWYWEFPETKKTLEDPLSL
jgi:hypothetical protein